MSESIQCPCGTIIEDYTKYMLLNLKKELGEGGEIDILCSNDYCYLRELGFLKFNIDEKGKITLEKEDFMLPM